MASWNGNPSPRRDAILIGRGISILGLVGLAVLWTVERSDWLAGFMAGIAVCVVWSLALDWLLRGESDG